MTDITFQGTNSLFFINAFFDANLTLASLEATSQRNVVTNTVTTENSATGMVTTFTGSNFLVDSDGNPVQGTINSMSFVQNGVLQGSFSGLNWGAVDFLTALANIQDRFDFAALAALINGNGPITIDATNAAGGFDFEGLIEPFAEQITQPITMDGSAFGDQFEGGSGDDLVRLGTSTVSENFIDASLGNDTLDFRGGDDDTYTLTSFDDIPTGITLSVDAEADTGSATFQTFTQTFLGVQGAADDDTGNGMGFAGTTFGDVFNLTSRDNGFLDIFPGEGDDTLNLTMNERIRLVYTFGLEGVPTEGLEADFGAGVVSNDGFGDRDEVNILGGTEGLEIRGTEHNDSVVGTDLNDRLIPESGDDTFDGAGGSDDIRYNRDEVGPVDVDLQAGTATGTWGDAPFSDTLFNVENIRGSLDGGDTLRGTDGVNFIDGNGGNDLIDGRGGNDFLFGEDGNDTIIDGGGFDFIDGGDGIDLFMREYANLPDDLIVVVDLETGGIFPQDNPDSTEVIQNIENVITLDDFDKQIIGDGQNNLLQTAGGDDTLEGRGGNDTLRGGGGDDTFFGELGNDRAEGNAGDDNFYNEPGDDTFLGGDGFDRVWYQDAGQAVSVDLLNETAIDGFGNTDTLRDIERVIGSDFNDTLRGDNADNSFTGEQGDDIINGRGGVDYVFYGRATSGITVDLNSGVVTGGEGNDTLMSIEDIDGSDFDDVLNGSAANNFLDGNEGNDTLNGRGGDDFIRGGNGIDTAVMGVALVDADFTAIPGGFEVSSDQGVDQLVDIEFFQFTDGLFSVENLFPGEQIDGTPAPDTLQGSEGDDTFRGRGSSDEILGEGGNDLIDAGIGADTVEGGVGDDTITGLDGFDRLSGGSGDDSLLGNNGSDEVHGDAGNDTLNGGLGADTMDGGADDDLLDGLEGFDSLMGGSGDDTVNGNAGNDTLHGDTGADALYGGIGFDVLEGGADNDRLFGNDGFDSLSGNAGDDRLEGNAGNDRLHGGAGGDVLRGGLGADTFVFELGDGSDRIADFQNNIDAIELDAGLFDEANPVPSDITNYVTRGEGNIVILDFGNGDTLTFTGVTSTASLIDDISIMG